MTNFASQLLSEQQTEYQDDCRRTKEIVNKNKWLLQINRFFNKVFPPSPPSILIIHHSMDAVAKCIHDAATLAKLNINLMDLMSSYFYMSHLPYKQEAA
jgi:hypothetical protein